MTMMAREVRGNVIDHRSSGHAIDLLSRPLGIARMQIAPRVLAAQL